MLVSLKLEVRTYASHCECSLHLYHPAWLIRHLHIIFKSKKNTKIYTVDRAVTGKAFVFVTLTYGSWTANWTDSPIPNSRGLVGNVDWGGSLAVVAYKFPGLNRLIDENPFSFHSRSWDSCQVGMSNVLSHDGDKILV